MDSSVYVPTQDTMIEPIRGNNSNDRSVNFGPVLWDVLGQVDSSIGGATYLIGTFFETDFVSNSSIVF